MSNCMVVMFYHICFLFVLAAGDSKEGTPSHNLQEEDSDCPRDSGCFISSECLDSKEETEQLTDTVYS